MVSIWSSSKQVQHKIRGSKSPIPKFQPGASWGEGDKGGAGSPPRVGKGLEVVGGSPHGCSAGGRRTHRMGAPGAPLARGSGVWGWLQVLLSLPQGPAP